MNRKGTKLITIAIIFVMLLGCMSTLLSSIVYATETTEVALNKTLYTAVKASLEDQGISFTYDATTYKITVDTSLVTQLDLNENSISDLTGLEYFTSLTHLDLSGNNLTSESNLSALNKLTALNYLDLSTNQLEDITDIDSLVSGIISNGGTVLLSNQTVKLVYEVTTNDSSANIQLPKILKRLGYLKSGWCTPSAASSSSIVTYRPEEVTDTESYISVNINKIVANGGLLSFKIYVYDDSTMSEEQKNLNPASSNILKGSIFYIYVVAHDEDSTAIEVPDSNMYAAVKEQLTAGQTVNSELASYPYSVDVNGDAIYDECTYSKETAYYGSTKVTAYVLTIAGESEPSYILYNGTVYEYATNASGYPYFKASTAYTTEYETTTVTITDDTTGTQTTYSGYKVLHNGEKVTLYEEAYDDPQVFVIDNNVLNNKITSLILNNKEIRDLTGLEKFVGLESSVNVSHNYLSDIDPIYDLVPNKATAEDEMQSNYLEYLSTDSDGNLTTATSEIKTAKSSADSTIKEIYEVLDKIYTAFQEGSEIVEYTETTTEVTENGTTTTKTEKVYNENYATELAAKEEEIEALIDSLYGYYNDNSEWVTGLLEELDEDFSTIKTNLSSAYSYLSSLYEIYTKGYKLTTLLTTDLNYLSIEDYEKYSSSYNSSSAATVKALVSAEVSRISNLEQNEGLSELDIELLYKAFSGISSYANEDYPITAYFTKVLESEGTAADWRDYIDTFRTIALYSEMYSYCLIERMENSTTTVDQCYAIEYLENRISSFEMDGLDTTEEQVILEKLENSTEDASDALYTVYKEFSEATVDYSTTSSSLKLDTCDGYYYNVVTLNRTLGNLAVSASTLADKAGVDSTDKEFTTIYSAVSNISELFTDVYLYDIVKYSGSTTKWNGEDSELYSYKEIVALMTKMTSASGEVETYITLPDLKSLDISYNSYLDGIDRLGELTGLRELYANSDYLSDVSVVNWSAIKYLRKVGFNYNYLTDITPFEQLTYLVDLDVSHNLLSGALDFSFYPSKTTLENFDASYNQLTDISVVLRYLDNQTGGSYGDYLARTDTVNMNFGYQNITIDVSDLILLADYPSTVNIDLPKIFNQLLSIDVSRTAFGETSQSGRVESEGGYVTLSTGTTGDKVGTVAVVAMSGNGTAVDTCVGIGTTATINYTVGSRYVSSVSISPDTATVSNGETATFTVTVDGENVTDSSVTWSISGQTSASTTISEDGILTVGDDEQDGTITITATSNFDSTKSGSATVTIARKDITTFELSPDTASVEKGTTASNLLTLTIDGTNLEDSDKGVTWTMVGLDSAGAEVSLSSDTSGSVEDGVVTLTVASDEAASQIAITATSTYDTTKTDTSTITLYTKEVTGVTISPETEAVETGKTATFTATVTGNNLETADLGVTYTVYAPSSSTTSLSTGTTITSEGLLTVDSSEANTTLVVRATSDYDSSKYAEATVTVAKTVTADDLVLGYDLDEDDETMIIGVSPTTTKTTFASILISDDTYTVVVTSSDGDTTRSSSDYVVTGDIATIYLDDEPIAVYTIVVKGDVNGDGVANALDSSLIKAHRAKTSLLEDEFLRAADINDDGKVNAVDSRLLLYHRAKIDGYIL